MPVPRKILLVGRDNFLLPLYARSFKEAGFEVRLLSAQDVLQGGGSSAPDLLLYALEEEKEGAAFLKKIRKEAVYGTTPVICLSHDWTSPHRARLLRAGAAMHLIKSQVTPGEVVEHAHRLLS